VQEYTIEVQKNGHYVGYISQELDVLLKYLGGLHSHLWRQVMLFKPRIIDEACVQAQYLENMGKNKGQPSGSK
jgi:hypothetical protein